MGCTGFVLFGLVTCVGFMDSTTLCGIDQVSSYYDYITLDYFGRMLFKLKFVLDHGIQSNFLFFLEQEIGWLKFVVN